MFETIKWPEDMKPSRSPIHFTNELTVDASPETIWSILTDLSSWPDFYPEVTRASLVDGAGKLAFGAQFEFNPSGIEVFAKVEEFEPMSRLAWGGGLMADPSAKAYHAWIITPTATGTLLWTEETQQGARWLDFLRPEPDLFWRMHETLLQNLARVAARRERA